MLYIFIFILINLRILFDTVESIRNTPASEEFRDFLRMSEFRNFEEKFSGKEKNGRRKKQQDTEIHIRANRYNFF